MQIHFAGGPLDGHVADSRNLSDPEACQRFLEGATLEFLGHGSRRGYIYQRQGEPGELDSLIPAGIVLYFVGVSTAAPGRYRGERDLFRPAPP